MSLVSVIDTLARHALKALRLMHHACKAAAVVNKLIQDSLLPDDVKTESAAWLAATTALCDNVAVAIVALEQAGQ